MPFTDEDSLSTFVAENMTRAHITRDKKMLKAFLFELSLATCTFASRSFEEERQIKDTQCCIEQLTACYDNDGVSYHMISIYLSIYLYIYLSIYNNIINGFFFSFPFFRETFLLV